MQSVKIAAWSGGKDSTYMVNELLRRGMQLDEIIFCDTGKEFPIMYDYIERVKKFWEDKYGANIYLLNWKVGHLVWNSWAEEPFKKGQYVGKIRGFPFHMGMSWCTRELKVKPLKRYVAKKYNGKLVEEYVGIAYNEPDRVKESGEIYPLVEWEITEDFIAEEMVKLGLHNPLYNHFHRTGCYNCPKQSLTSLYKLYTHYPDLWDKIVVDFERYSSLPVGVTQFKGYSIDELIVKFKKYEKLGKPTNYLDEEQPIGCMCK